tara:strand:- start:35 stop:358 length:324 start_codon:yes stop_codon:yes gene_type:complete
LGYTVISGSGHGANSTNAVTSTTTAATALIYTCVFTIIIILPTATAATTTATKDKSVGINDCHRAGNVECGTTSTPCTSSRGWCLTAITTLPASTTAAFDRACACVD